MKAITPKVETKQKLKPHFTHVAFSGGGNSAIVYLGAIRLLKQEGFDKSIINYAGYSAGALFATLFALDVPLDEIEHIIKTSPLELDIYESFSKLINDKGFIDPTIYTSRIEKYLDKLTFMDLSKKTGKNLIIIATHMETMEATHFCVDKTPNVLVKEALHASVALPLVIAPVKIGNDYYIDGGVACNTVPLVFEPSVPKENILILQIGYSINIDKKLIHDNLLYYITTVIGVFCKNNTLINIVFKEYPYYIYMTNYDISMIPLNIIDNKLTSSISEAAIDKCIEYGYEDTYNYFKSKGVL